MKDLVSKVNAEEVIGLKKQRVRSEQEISSIRDRIRDIEWRIEGAGNHDVADKMMDERQRALDKLRATQVELLTVRERLIELGEE